MKKSLLLIIFVLGTCVQSYAATTFISAAWIPYWKKTDGASTTRAYLSTFTEISPFSYEVTSTGSLIDAARIRQEPWTTLFADAKKQGVRVYPSILWTDGAAMERILNNTQERKSHIDEIVSEVVYYKFDGIDIDYENKTAATKQGYSLFLQELAARLKKNNKKLVCTIEARTPLESRYTKLTPSIRASIEYANDYKVIGKVCDQVRIMAYDQATTDVQLTGRYATTLYRPVSDIAWVRKVLTLALEDIPAKKIVVGVATYGYKYEYSQDNGATTYKRIGSMNYYYAQALAQSIGVTPTRNVAGELSFTYASSTDASNATPGVTKQYLVWYSDALAIADKIYLAKLYKLGGVAVFKVDGAQDPALFKVLK